MTLVLSAAVVLVLGYVLVTRVSAGLVEVKQRGAVAETEDGRLYARAQFQALGGTNDPELQSTVTTVVSTLSERGGQAGDFGVLLRPDDASQQPAYSRQLDAIDPRVPPELETEVVDDNALAYQYTSLRGDDGVNRPYLVVGAPVDTESGSFQLYYLFPLEREQSTVALVQNTLVGTGAALVLLLVGLAAMVARQVVRPVRVAAKTADRLAAGLLTERMTVSGEDDLARLASAFNQMAENLQHQIVALEDLSRLQRRFTSDVSHELRTPLTTIRMASEVLYGDRDDFDEHTRRTAELLRDQVERFEGLLADLLEISRYDAGFASLEAEPTDLGALVHRAAATVEPLAEGAGSEIRVDIPASPVVAEVDPRRVERVLRNLLGNAVEYGEARPIDVRLVAGDRAAAIGVTDHGVGLTAEAADAVFDRFWRADPSRARKTGGTGLGLSISREDARLHGGWLEACGRPGAGSLFRLTLPLHAGAEVTESPLPLEPPVPLVEPAESTDSPEWTDSAESVESAELAGSVELDEWTGSAVEAGDIDDADVPVPSSDRDDADYPISADDDRAGLMSGNSGSTTGPRHG